MYQSNNLRDKGQVHRGLVKADVQGSTVKEAAWNSFATGRPRPPIDFSYLVHKFKFSKVFVIRREKNYALDSNRWWALLFAR